MTYLATSAFQNQKAKTVIHPPPGNLMPLSFLRPKIRGVLVFEIQTKRGVMKKLLRDRGLVEKGGFSLKGSILLHFSFRKVFIIIGILFFVW